MAVVKRVTVEMAIEKSSIDEVLLLREFIEQHIGVVGEKLPWHGLHGLRVLEQKKDDLPMSMDKGLVILMGASADWVHGRLTSASFKKLIKETFVAFAAPAVDEEAEKAEVLLHAAGWRMVREFDQLLRKKIALPTHTEFDGVLEGVRELEAALKKQSRV